MQMLKQFLCAEETSTPRTITEAGGITHIEELPIDEFVKTIETFKTKIISEKLDGTNLRVGIDEKGLYTSREGKTPKKARFYNIDDYAVVANYNSFRGAHAALEKVKDIIKKYFSVGDSAEIEVLFGRQPNTVTYGSNDTNYIVFLRGIDGTPDEKVKALANELHSKKVSAKSTVVSSVDGVELDVTEQTLNWQFTKAKTIKPEKLDTSAVDELLSKLKEYLKQKNTVLTDKTNDEVLSLNLTSVHKDDRARAKVERDAVSDKVMTEFKMPIKEMLLNNFVRKIKPALQSSELHPSEDIGIEGIVVRDPETGNQVKIVDKDTFTAINTFNSSVRASIAGLVKTTDKDADAKMRGGIFGEAKIRIANLLGVKELALSSGAKKTIAKFKKATIEDTVNAFAESLNISSFPSMKTKITAILGSVLDDIDQVLAGFKNDSSKYTLKLKTGKEIGISPEIKAKTLTAFAETRKDVLKMKNAVSESKSPAQLVVALYGKTISNIFDGATINMKESLSLLKLFQEDDGAATVASPAGGDTGTTASSSIAPVPTKLFNNAKVITRRKRTFVKPKKFPMPDQQKVPLLKSMTEAWSHVDDMEFATDVDDSAHAKNDIDFKKLRNELKSKSDNVTTMDVNRYLDKAHQLNDEEDAVTFGMETDMGDIKVYVNVTQADAFERALGELLGSEDDPEKVINDLSNTFDIIDVEWPESFGDTEEPDSTTEEPAEDGQEDGPEATGGDETDGAEIKPGGEEAEPDEHAADIDLSTSFDESGDEAKDDESEEDEKEETPKSDKDSDESSEDEKNKESSADEDESDEDGLKSKKVKTKESLSYDGSISLLKEAESDVGDSKEHTFGHNNLDHDAQKLLKLFAARKDKAVITLMLSLGVPAKNLLTHRAAVKKSIEPAAELFLTNSGFRIWSRKLITAINNAGIAEDTIENRMIGKYQKAIYAILKAIGLPDSAESQNQRLLINGIKNVAKLAVTESKIRIYLVTIAEILGVSDAIRNTAEDIEEGVITEDLTQTIGVVTKLLSALGFDITATRSLEMQMKSADAKRALTKLNANISLVNKLNTLTSMIENKISPNTNERHTSDFL